MTGHLNTCVTGVCSPVPTPRCVVLAGDVSPIMLPLLRQSRIVAFEADERPKDNTKHRSIHVCGGKAHRPRAHARLGAGGGGFIRLRGHITEARLWPPARLIEQNPLKASVFKLDSLQRQRNADMATYPMPRAKFRALSQGVSVEGSNSILACRVPMFLYR